MRKGLLDGGRDEFTLAKLRGVSAAVGVLAAELAVIALEVSNLISKPSQIVHHQITKQYLQSQAYVLAFLIKILSLVLKD